MKQSTRLAVHCSDKTRPAICTHDGCFTSLVFEQELALPDVPIMMTLLDERPSGKLCVSYQKQPVVDAVDEIKATTQRIPNLDIAKVS